MRPLISCCLVGLLAGSYPISVLQPPQTVRTEWGDARNGLRLGLTTSPEQPDRRVDRQFYIAIENIGDNDVVINLGHMLANGKVMFPYAIRLVLTDPAGTTRDLEYFDRRYPGVAGRVDDFIVALRAGSVYALRVPLDRFWSPATKEFELNLARGQYRIESRFVGDGARYINLDTPGIALLNFWKGTLRSNSATFEVP